MKNILSKHLINVEKPARYTGGEYNTPDMTKPCNVRFCLCFTDIYEVGMSNLGVSILYDIVNKQDNLVCERCFAPWTDLGDILKKEKILLLSIETQQPLKDFDVVGFSVTYEMGYTNILYMLDLAQIPFRAKDRDESYPIIIGGGPISANPEPIIDFFDAFFIGEGEENLLEFLKVSEKYKGDKTKILQEASKIEGVYVPSLVEINNGVVTTKIKKATIYDLDKAPFPLKPLVPNIEIVHDRSVVELYRGCYAGCRFCQACFFYRPIRYRESNTVVGIVNELIKNTGYDEVGLSSLSSGDYQQIIKTITDLNALTESKNVVLQLPSLRLDSFTASLMGSARKSSLTFAPEAGSQRLRDVINKNITDEDIESSMRLAFSIGYRTVKLYFMLGLPTETDEDVMGIVDIVRKIRKLYMEVTRRRDININVSTAMFIPKPLTPFQWAEQISSEEMYRKQNMLKKEFYAIKGVRYSWHGAEISVLEGIFARGDRKLSYLIEKAYSLGCYFDSWSEKFDREKWQNAIESCQVDVKAYTGERAVDSVLSWDFIDFGVSKKYLLAEYNKALKGEITPPCKENCNGCGASNSTKCRQYFSDVGVE